MKLEIVKNLYLGAEAEISLCNWLGFRVIAKKRKSKGYRVKDLEKKIIATRMAMKRSLLS